MRHAVKKIKFGLGADANTMLVRKLATNFIFFGTIVSTEKRIKILKSYLEHLIEKSKTSHQAHKNVLLRKLGNKNIITMLFEKVGKNVQHKAGGYVRMVKLQQRSSDGASMAKLEWVHPV